MIAIAVLLALPPNSDWSYFCGIYLCWRRGTNDLLVDVGIFTGRMATLRQGLAQPM